MMLVVVDCESWSTPTHLELIGLVDKAMIGQAFQ